MTWLGTLIVATTLVVTGCAGPAAEQAQPSAPRTFHIDVTLPPPEPGVHLTFVQQRLDEGTDRVGLRVENNSEKTLAVREVGLDWPGYGTFTGPAHATVEPGATLDLPMRLPAERCHADVSALPVGSRSREEEPSATRSATWGSASPSDCGAPDVRRGGSGRPPP